MWPLPRFKITLLHRNPITGQRSQAGYVTIYRQHGMSQITGQQGMTPTTRGEIKHAPAIGYQIDVPFDPLFRCHDVQCLEIAFVLDHLKTIGHKRGQATRKPDDQFRPQMQ